MVKLIKIPFAKKRNAFVALYIMCTMLFLASGCVKQPELEESSDTRAVKVVYNANTSYEYPVKPGTAEWATFETGEQMLKACQLPQSILENVNTKDLAKICLDYPLYLEYTAFNDQRQGISILIENFNGLKELAKRKDGALELMEIYKKFPVLTTVQSMSSKDYETPYRLPFLELLLADNVFIKQLDSKNSVELEKLVAEKYEAKLKYSEVYSLYNIKNTFLLWAINVEKNSMLTRSSAQLSTAKRYITDFKNVDPNLLTEVSRAISGL